MYCKKNVALILDRHNCVDHNLPCRNNGTCVELTPSFRCVCKTSYRGSLCDHGESQSVTVFSLFILNVMKQDFTK